MLIAPSTLGYLKFSLNVLGINDPNSAQSIQSQNFVGIGYGVGVKTLVDAHWALSLEAQQINYKAKSDIVINGATNPASAKPSQSMATLGLHYFY
jgi:opacity protein-like surface antigen